MPPQVDGFFDKQATVQLVAAVRVSVMIQHVARIPHTAAIMLHMHTPDYHVIQEIVSIKQFYPYITLFLGNIYLKKSRCYLLESGIIVMDI